MTKSKLIEMLMDVDDNQTIDLAISDGKGIVMIAELRDVKICECGECCPLLISAPNQREVNNVVAIRSMLGEVKEG